MYNGTFEGVQKNGSGWRVSKVTKQKEKMDEQKEEVKLSLTEFCLLLLRW